MSVLLLLLLQTTLVSRAVSDAFGQLGAVTVLVV
jgi:hypothetical protein